MTIATNITKKWGDRYYPCKLCPEQHPSVTTILPTSPALMGWKQKMGTKKLLMFKEEVQTIMNPQIFDHVKKETEKKWREQGETSDFWKNGTEMADEAADHGTMAHAAFEMFLKGKEVDKRSLSAPSARAFEVFESFARSNEIKTIDTEHTFYNCAMGYAGTADWRGTINGKLTLADWKTSTGIFEGAVVQAWANAISDEMQNSDNLYQQILIGRFGKDGSTDILIIPRKGLENGFGGYEQARVLIQACVPWHTYKNEWSKRFPYKKPKQMGDIR